MSKGLKQHFLKSFEVRVNCVTYIKHIYPIRGDWCHTMTWISNSWEIFVQIYYTSIYTKLLWEIKGQQHFFFTFHQL